MNGGFNDHGLTLIEMIIALSAILVLVLAAVPPLLNSFALGGREVIDDARSIVHLLSTAQSNAVSGKDNSDWGVKLINGGTASCDATDESNCIVIYKGSDFNNRNSSFDQVVKLSASNKFGTTLPNMQLKTVKKDCGSAAQTDGSGTQSWSSASSACGSDDVDAVSVLSQAGHRTEILRAYDFGFEVPSDATITGLTAVVEKMESGECPDDVQVQLFNNLTSIGDNKAEDGVAWPPEDYANAYGGSDDTWGYALTPELVNSTNFGIGISAEQVASCLASTRVDSISMYIWYTQNQPPMTDFFFNKISGVAKNLPGNPADPRLHYTFENATTTDISGNELHGQPDVGLSASTTCAYGSDCFEFNGSTSAITVPTNTLTSSDKDGFTMSVWVNTPNQTSGQHGILGQSINTSWSSYSNGGFELNAAEVPTIQTCTYETPTGSGAVCNTSPTVAALSPDEWHHLVGVFEADNRTQYIYVDGSYVDDSLIQEIADYNTIGSFKIGRQTSAGAPDYFKGGIDDIRIFDRSLTSVEVNQLFEFTKPSSTLDLQSPALIYITSGFATSTIYVYPSGAIMIYDNE